MTDPILRAFLATQLVEGMALAAASDLVEVVPLAGVPPRKYLVRFRCTGLVRADDGAIVEADEFAVGVFFREDHLRVADPGTLVTWLHPRTVFHPNLRAPAVCLGRVAPGMSLVDIIYQLHAVITYNKATLDDALNGAAAAWARENPHRLPVDRRPLKRRLDAAPAAVEDDFDFDVEEVES